ncbi:hypothetical protein GCM10011314_17670 [Knoellia flava]|uniref:Uncharacterized protein n=1 Tax=Knoellia flava TaxID=913969 RepID=A0A8H9FU90_9MICO|nr:hypothetical protein GCM10011314_17670 [Knoellia flava]
MADSREARWRGPSWAASLVGSMPGLYAQFTQDCRVVLHDSAHLGWASSSFAQDAYTQR